MYSWLRHFTAHLYPILARGCYFSIEVTTEKLYRMPHTGEVGQVYGERTRFESGRTCAPESFGRRPERPTVASNAMPYIRPGFTCLEVVLSLQSHLWSGCVRDLRSSARLTMHESASEHDPRLKDMSGKNDDPSANDRPKALGR